MSEHRVARHQNFCPRTDHIPNRIQRNSPIYFNTIAQSPLISQVSQPANLVHRPRNELLPAKSRIHRHYEHVIGNVENLAQRINGSCWINYYARYASMTLDQVQRAIQMNARLLMHRNPIRPSFAELWNELIGILDH